MLIDLFFSYRLLRPANGNPVEEQEIITWLIKGRIPEKERPQYLMSTYHPERERCMKLKRNGMKRRCRKN